MTIESRYWKTDLSKYAHKFKYRYKFCKRIEEKQQVNFEKDIIISLFMLRVLMERKKCSSKTEQFDVSFFRYPCKSDNVNWLNDWRFEEKYDLDKEEVLIQKPQFLVNQLIHHAALFAYREKGRWAGVWVAAPNQRRNYLYRIPIFEIIKLLEIAADDYPVTMLSVYDQKKGDYKVFTD